MWEPLLLTLCELFGLKNEVPADQSYKYEKNTAGKSASAESAAPTPPLTIKKLIN